MLHLNSHTETAGAITPFSRITPMVSIPARQRKSPPLHPGAVLADIFEEQAISLRTAAGETGISKSVLDRVLKGQSQVTASTAVLLSTYLGNPDSAKLWLDMQRDYDLWHARADLASKCKKITPLKVKR